MYVGVSISFDNITPVFVIKGKSTGRIQVKTRRMIKFRAVHDVKTLDIYTFSLSWSIIKHSKKSSSRERSHVMRGSLTFRNSRSGSNSVSWLLIPFVRPRSEGATRCYNFHIVPFKVKLHPQVFLLTVYSHSLFFDPIFFSFIHPRVCCWVEVFFSGTLFVFSHLLKRGREVLDSHI